MITNLGMRLERFVIRHALGMTPDPATWPAPSDIDSLPLPGVIEKSAENIRGIVLDKEFSDRWPHRRTVIGAQAYRFETNAEYDCGWRLVNAATRRIEESLAVQFDIVMIIPPPPVFRRVPTLEWATERLARLLNCAFRPDLIGAVAPLVDHADRLRKLPAPWGGLYTITRPESVYGKSILLCDWRWEKGKSMQAVSKLLRHAGADPVSFAWME